MNGMLAHHEVENMPMDNARCKASMTLNWYTSDICLISTSWHINSVGMFAASCLVVILLVVSLELLRRLQREYDAYIRHQDISEEHGGLRHTFNKTKYQVKSARGTNDQPSEATQFLSEDEDSAGRPRFSRARTLQRQIIRSFLHMLQFAVAYLIMLLAMSYNGYIIVSIIVGAFIGPFALTWDQLMVFERVILEVDDVTGCCG